MGCIYKTTDGYCDLHSDGIEFREPCIEGPCGDEVIEDVNRRPELDNKPLTNAGRIRRMSDEELAKLLMETAFYDFKRVCRTSTFFGHGECDEMCVPCIMGWLQQPTEE